MHQYKSETGAGAARVQERGKMEKEAPMVFLHNIKSLVEPLGLILYIYNEYTYIKMYICESSQPFTRKGH